MKKIFCLVFCALFIFSLTACKGENTDTAKHNIDVEYYAKLGQINDFAYKVGDDVEATKSALSQTLDDHGESNYFDFPSDEYTIMTDGNAYCCYKTDEPNLGLTHVVKNGDAYGFQAGTVSTQVRDAMSTLGFDTTEREALREEIFFLPAAADMTVLKYTIEDKVVLFVFQEHALSATVVSKA